MASPPDRLSQALEAVIARFAGLVRGVGRRHGLTDDDIAELLQDVRVRLWRAQSENENLSELPASYVHRAATTAALDLIRRRRRKRESGRDFRRASQERLLPEQPGPEREVQAGDLVERVAEAVEGLSDSRRPVVRMYLAGYSREEIAATLGWTEAKTRNLLYRGLAELRERLARMGIGPEAIE